MWFIMHFMKIFLCLSRFLLVFALYSGIFAKSKRWKTPKKNTMQFFDHTSWWTGVCPEYQYSLWYTLKFVIMCQFGLSGGDVPSQNYFYRGSHA
jgi:uncharacterized protein (UPF0303 family)